jgi:F-type H+-transporting ATPase subunit b
LPQLDVSTFASQVFGIVLGFLLVYLFVSKVITPQIEDVLLDRDSHTNGLLKAAHKLKTEADEIENDATIALESAQEDCAATESELILALQEQNLSEKKALDDLFFEKSKKEQKSLAESSQRAFSDALKEMDGLVDVAMGSMACSAKKENAYRS